MKIIPLLSITMLLFFSSATNVRAAPFTNLFQITTEGSQQANALIYGNFVIYTNFGGSENIDIWAYDLKTKENFPIIVKPGQQFATGFYKNLIVYDEFNEGTQTYNVRLYDAKTGEDILISDGSGSHSGGVTNGTEVVYITGGACGSLHSYNLSDSSSAIISESACAPVRISGNIVVWAYAAPGGTNVYGYDLKKDKQLDIATGDGFQEVPNIFKENVVWLNRLSGAYGAYNAIVMKNLKTGEEKVLYESSTDTLQYPAISEKYVVWSQSSQQHVGGVQGVDLKTDEAFEVQAQGPHQNSHTTPSIWKNTAVWMSWRTGNGDIYGAEFTTENPASTKTELNNPDESDNSGSDTGSTALESSLDNSSQILDAGSSNNIGIDISTTEAHEGNPGETLGEEVIKMEAGEGSGKTNNTTTPETKAEEGEQQEELREDAFSKLKEKLAENDIYITTADAVRLGERDGKFVYEINGLRNHRLFGFIPIKTEVRVFVSAESGELITEEQSLFSRIIDAISF